MSSESPTRAGDRVRTRPWLLLTGSLFIGLALALLFFGNSSRSGQSRVEANIQSGDTADTGGRLLEPGDVAQNFLLPDLDGRSYDLAGLRGRPVVLNFWATWCAPCRLEMPELQAAYERHQDDDLVILAINLDEPAGRVRRFFYDEMGLTFVPLLDEGGMVTESYGVINFPTTFFIDSGGVIAAVHRGPLVQTQIEENLARIIPNQ